MKNLFYVTVVILLSIVLFAGCGPQVPTLPEYSSPPTEKPAPSPTITEAVSQEPTSTPTETVSQEPTSTPTEQLSSSGTANGSSVEILDYDIIKDYAGNDAIQVYYNYTNNTNDSAMSLGHIVMSVYQNGIGLTLAIPKESSGEFLNQKNSINPGATIKCAWVYGLSDKSPVEVELSVLGYGAVAAKTFDIE